MLENEKKRILHFIQHLCLYKFTSFVKCSSKQKEQRRKRRDSRLVNSKYTQNVYITMRLQRMKKKKRNSLAIVISEKRNTNNKKRIFLFTIPCILSFTDWAITQSSTVIRESPINYGVYSSTKRNERQSDGKCLL